MHSETNLIFNSASKTLPLSITTYHVTGVCVTVHVGIYMSYVFGLVVNPLLPGLLFNCGTFLERAP